ncbi:MAG: BglG family transcription antiterminator [Lachnospiraceae bacterium]|nr:BglG family transcription antiterminator [Lachnospiraceae bacterium]
MNKRSREILSQLITKTEYGQKMSIDNLADMFQVSTRTIRYDINQINDFLNENDLKPLKLKKHGVIQVCKDMSQVKDLLKQEEFYSFKLSKQERIYFSSVLLICADNYITLMDIAQKLFVSRSTIVQDLEYLKDYLREHQLYLMSYSNKGLLLEGKERKRRELLFEMIQEDSSVFRELPVFQHLLNCVFDKDRINLEDQSTVEKIINEAENSYGRFLTDESFRFLTIYMEISVARFVKGQYIDEMLEENTKYEMASGIITQMQQYLLCKIPEEEIYYLAEILNRMKYLKKTTSNHEIVKMQIIVRNFIGSISKKIGRNLQGDYLFYENLINHLESTFSTVGDYQGISNVVEEVLERYPNVLKIAADNVGVFEDYIGRKLSNTEIAYIVVHICAAIERNKNENARYSVMIVCNGGIGTSQLLLARLEKFFHLNVVDVIPAHNLEHADLSEVDVIISTISLQNKGVEYIQVDPLLTDEDCIKVGKQLSEIQPKKDSEQNFVQSTKDAVGTLEKIQSVLEKDLQTIESLNEIKKIVSQYFHQDKEKLLSEMIPAGAIQLNVICADWKEAIRKSAKYLLENDAITEHYIDEMIRNVMENGPYIVVAPGFALPHESLDAGAKEAGMSLIRLATPVPFGREEMDPVEWVCCLSAIDKEIHLKAMFHLVNLFYNQSFRKEINQCKTGEEVFNTIKYFEYEMR